MSSALGIGAVAGMFIFCHRGSYYYPAGIVTKGSPSESSLSIIEKSSIRKVNVRFEAKSPSSIQYQ